MIAAVRFAHIHGLQMAVRGGGDSVAGFSTNVGGIVIDLSAMNDVRVDTTTGWVMVGGGAV
jgi:FAD/FMN-containing dehydrogenase